LHFLFTILEEQERALFPTLSQNPHSNLSLSASGDQLRRLLTMAEDDFTQLLIAATTTGNLPLIKSHFPSLPPSTPILKSIAISAAKSNQPEILTWCLSQGYSLPSQSLNNELYHAACDSQSIAIFQVLVNHGFDLNAHTSEMYYCGTALVAACMHGNLELAKWLLGNGQDPNAEFSYEALVYAVSGENRSVEMVELLLEHGAKLQGTGAAISAAEKDDVAMVELCLENGCEIEESEMWWLGSRDEGDVEGTALYRACRAGAVRVVEMLLDRGADLGFRDELGRDCVGIARTEGRDEVVKVLMQRGLVHEQEVRPRNTRIVSEENWAWMGKEMPDVFCVD
jgi:ankyrin repeat protein